MRNMIVSHLRFLAVNLLVFGGLYTAVATGIGQLLFPAQANGSLIIQDGQVAGSALIGQPFDRPEYFSGRSGNVSQLSPVSGQQHQLVAERTQAELQKNPEETAVPNDLVTASGSGLDPHISAEAAEFQVKRIAAVRQVSEQAIRDIIEKNKQQDWFSNRTFVNVLELNLALDQL